ncbi:MULTISPECIES: pyridoxamine 5'-phosphate oxidase family protein [unclassified Pseudonocardia]|uniref:pyridoxamine 5'-phosphate oxidase family protein n=1 Tax=unclassified Pseudonocardia TaxID=2619320 RepID=UPI0001FFE414|nr:pyridoxamine 5'-phosphate oxidase family protein [Pseudonocardia sp. Ae707_Ps1]OLM18582.1 Flavodoxin reductase (ferredoxin-NADPH reductase) family 1 [Pseudonocardia sp. Ae707_Ps1]
MRRFLQIAFTPTVTDQQKRAGSHRAYSALAAGPGTADPLDAAARNFVEERDSFYAATVGETGWPYIQHRGGPPGFVHVLDESTIAFADVRGNRQYVTAGNLAHDGRIALFFMDYARRRRLKLLGTATALDGAAHPELAARLDGRRTPGRVEHLVVIDVQGYDWNCPQHITPRFGADDLERAGLRVADVAD